MRRALRLLAVTALAASAVLTYSATAFGVGGCFAQAGAPGTAPVIISFGSGAGCAANDNSTASAVSTGATAQGGAYSAAEDGSTSAANNLGSPNSSSFYSEGASATASQDSSTTRAQS